MANILIVESDDDTRAILRMALECAGHTVVGAGDDTQALAVMRSGRVPLLVLLGLSPDGIGDNPVIRAITADPSLARRHRVIALTPGMADQAEEKLHHARSCLAGFLPKPFDLADLLAMVAQVAVRASMAGIPAPLPSEQRPPARGHPMSLPTSPTHMQIQHLMGQLSNSNARIADLLRRVAQLAAAPTGAPAQGLSTRGRQA